MDKQGRKFVMVDGSPYNAMLRMEGKVYKAVSHKGVRITFEEIDLDEYDKRVNSLAKKIADMPDVNLMSLLTDALFDLPLDYLKQVENKVGAELEKPKPIVKTKVDTTYRGSCVSLNVGGRNLVELRH